jgi:hypothetical protein
MKYQQKWALSKFQVIHPVTFGNKAAQNWRTQPKENKKFSDCWKEKEYLSLVHEGVDCWYVALMVWKREK